MTPYDANFDGQKLMYHPARVAQWLERGSTCGPLYTEATLSDQCNCRCLFCGVDYDVRRTGAVLDAGTWTGILDDLADLGNKAVMFSGHGEPLLHPRAAEIIGHGARRMSASVTTNGIALDEAGMELIDALEWIRFSVNAGTPEAYARVHGARPDAFDRVLANLAAAVERKRCKGLAVTIGVQCVLLDENADTAVALARRVREIGVDYFSLKPYSRHPLSRNRLDVDYARHADIGREVQALQTTTFKVVVRTGSIAKLGGKKPYGTCHGTHFLCFLSANGDVWECNSYAGDPRFRIGNAREERLAGIWNGPRRREVLEFIRTGLNLDECRDVCRMDECNRYLWRLKHPWPHDNFV